MLKRMLFLAAVAAATLAAGDAVRAQSAAQAFASFGLSVTSDPSPFHYTAGSAGQATIKIPAMAVVPIGSNSSDATGVDFTVQDTSFLDSGKPSTYNGAQFALTAMSTGNAMITGGIASQTFTGSLQIKTPSENIATGSFTGTLSQTTDGVASLAISMNSFTSSVFKPLTNVSFAIGATGVGTLSLNGTNFNNFTGGIGGNVAGAVAVPEPASLAMAGFGLLGLPTAVFVTRRRRAKADA